MLYYNIAPISIWRANGQEHAVSGKRYTGARLDTTFAIDIECSGPQLLVIELIHFSINVAGSSRNTDGNNVAIGGR